MGIGPNPQYYIFKNNLFLIYLICKQTNYIFIIKFKKYIKTKKNGELYHIGNDRRRSLW